MKIHPDALLLPQMTAEEFAQLVNDIRAHGLREAIKLDHSGEWLVDGRHRDLACPEAGVEPRYERLSEGTDILAYIMSANLHRRHLTVEQRAEIVQEVMRRYPDKSNREIAKLARVSPDTVNRIAISSERYRSVEKTIGADGKLRPAHGKINDEIKNAIIASLQANPAGQKEIAEHHGVSIGTVSGIKQRLFKAGALPRPASWAPPPPREQPRPPDAAPVDFKEYAAQVQARRAPPFDTLTREERGMGSKEYGAEQHPDRPPGWTRDDVFREEHGRVVIYTPDQRAANEVMKRFTTVFKPLRKIVKELPNAEDLELDKLDAKQRAEAEAYLQRHIPAAIAKLQALLAKAQRHQGRAG